MGEDENVGTSGLAEGNSGRQPENKVNWEVSCKNTSLPSSISFIDRIKT